MWQDYIWTELELIFAKPSSSHINRTFDSPFWIWLELSKQNRTGIALIFIFIFWFVKWKTESLLRLKIAIIWSICKIMHSFPKPKLGDQSIPWIPWIPSWHPSHAKLNWQEHFRIWCTWQNVRSSSSELESNKQVESVDNSSRSRLSKATMKTYLTRICNPKHVISIPFKNSNSDC